jgi:hypothetical protein
MMKARTLADQTNIPKTTGQQTNKEDDFQEVQRRKRCATDETTGTSKKATVQTKTPTALNIQRGVFCSVRIGKSVILSFG